jgi:hypothetical protein
MHHVGTISQETRITGKPFHAQCVCGTAGDFKNKSEASDYLTNHFARLQGISTTELVDATKAIAVAPVAKEKKDEEEDRAPQPKARTSK